LLRHSCIFCYKAWPYELHRKITISDFFQVQLQVEVATCEAGCHLITERETQTETETGYVQILFTSNSDSDLLLYLLMYIDKYYFIFCCFNFVYCDWTPSWSSTSGSAV